MALFESKAQREFKRKIRIKKSINKLKKLREKFERDMQDSLNKAREVREKGNMELYRAYREKIKKGIMYRDFLDDSISKIELLFSEVEFKSVTQESISNVIEEISKLLKFESQSKRIKKNIRNFEILSEKGEDGFFIIQSMVDNISSIISDGDISFEGKKISDDMIDKMIGEVSEEGNEVIDIEELERIKKSIGD